LRIERQELKEDKVRVGSAQDIEGFRFGGRVLQLEPVAVESSGEIRYPASFTSDEKYLYHTQSLAPEYGAGVYLYIEVINKNVNAL
jgi:hypothetical protein